MHLSELVELSIKDVKACRARGIDIYMDEWLTVDSDLKPCSVCLCGAVIVNTIKPKIDASMLGRTFMHIVDVNALVINSDAFERIGCLDYIRKGEIHRAIIDYYGGDIFRG